ncbi:MAG: iron ABC transporter permease [Clostridiales bacterium]|nr:iron ABC transporter permease [Clostridiales bacterium]
MKGKKIVSFAVIIVLLLGLFIFSVNSGSLKVSYGQLFRGLFVAYDDTVAIIYDLRFPRIIIAMLAGAALAVSGVLFQAVLKNPLADPGIIGISSGASFVSALIVAYFPTLFFFTPVFSFMGGMAACVLVYSLSYKNGFSPLRIILVGVAIDAVFSGLSSAFNSMSGQSYTSASELIEANISMKTWSDVRLLAIYVIIGLVLALVIAGRCNLLSLEDKTVRSLGVNVTALRLVVSVVAVLLASITTAVAGAVSFVGLIVPHMGRILVGSEHRLLIPFSALLGAFTMLLADTVGRLIAYPYEISPAVIMAVAGGPFFIILLKRSDKTYGN